MNKILATLLLSSLALPVFAADPLDNANPDPSSLKRRRSNDDINNENESPTKKRALNNDDSKGKEKEEESYPQPMDSRQGGTYLPSQEDFEELRNELCEMEIEFQERAPEVIERKNIEKLSVVSDKVHQLLMNGVSANEILVIFDVDGTLTTVSDPTKYRGRFDYDVSPRDNSPEIVRDLIRKGVNVILSSAWDKFEETLYRVSRLGLLEDLGVKDIMKDTKRNEYPFISVGFLYPIHITMISAGNIASAGRPSETDGFYRDKNLASWATSINPSEIRKVIFADDSKVNVDIFNKNLTGISEDGDCEGIKNIYAHADFFLYLLSKPKK